MPRLFQPSRLVLTATMLALLPGFVARAQEVTPAEVKPAETAAELNEVAAATTVSQAQKVAELAAAMKAKADNDPLKKLREEHEAKRLENAIRAEEHRAKQADLKMQIDALKTQLELADSTRKVQLADLQAEQEKLAAQNALLEQQIKAGLAQGAQDEARIKQSIGLKRAQFESEMLEREQALKRFEAEMAEKKAKHDESDLALRELRRDMEVEARNLQLQRERFDSKLRELDFSVRVMQKAVAERDQVDVNKGVVLSAVEYPEQPFENGVLRISDRRIALNGPIITGTADYVTERIHFFNNKSATQPIFIVIDRSPGGSVMEGYRILKAVEASKAPIHVLVKSFAASMAAAITTLAEHSYAYPNAIILHHQMSTMSWGNTTQMSESLEDLKEWERRLMAPIAAKMGIDQDTFRKQMYENNSGGDWWEFADEAQRLKWIDNIATSVLEEGYGRQPTTEAPKPMFWFEAEGHQRDSDGTIYMKLPPLRPFDYYFIHNPDRYYR